MKAPAPAWVRAFLTDEDLAAIAARVAAAEAGTSGEIRVHLEPVVPRRPFQRTPAPLDRAQQVFIGLGMHATRDRNAVLIYVAVDDHLLAILGDAAVHARVGDGYWTRVRDLMLDRLRRGQAREALLGAVDDVGAVLAQHFPRRPGDDNELPDRVSLGE